MKNEFYSEENAKRLHINFGEEVLKLSKSENLVAALTGLALEWIFDVGLTWADLEKFLCLWK
jgi:hypothetical protein